MDLATDDTIWDALEDSAYLGINDCTGDNLSLWNIDFNLPQAQTDTPRKNTEEQTEAAQVAQLSGQEDPFMGFEEAATDDDLFEGEILFQDSDELGDTPEPLHQQATQLNEIPTSETQHPIMPSPARLSHGTSTTNVISAPTATTIPPMQPTDTTVDLIMIDDNSKSENLSSAPTLRSPSRTVRCVTFDADAAQFFQAAKKEYDGAYLREQTRQLHSLACWVQAKAGQVHVPKAEGIRRGLAIWHHMIVERINQVRKAHLDISFKPPSESTSPRLFMQDTLKFVIVFQNPCSADGMDETYKANVEIETLRWEAEIMISLTAYYDSEKLRAIRETGLKYKVVDGFMLDLTAMCSYPLQQRTSQTENAQVNG